MSTDTFHPFLPRAPRAEPPPPPSAKPDDALAAAIDANGRLVAAAADRHLGPDRLLLSCATLSTQHLDDGASRS